MHWINNQKDFVSGLLFTAVGAIFALGALDHPVGSAARMGPGFFPRSLGILLAILGAILTLKSVGGRERRHGDIGPWDLRPLFFIIGANLLFGVLLVGLPALGLPPMGLLAAVFVLVVCASMGGMEFRWPEALALAAILTTCGYVLFVVVLGMPLQALPAFLH